ncbi:hypothetical protein ATY41_11515 [Leifsonia xyli subsp. xyli]|uniref:Transposase n=1 Tax=Leifsonia xyli subsp. xyli TaxID=59736 RepID=A0A1E2SJP6_LEIXY|nr:hypothetical protein ATY41_11515 [Leifsonia xyli subsp. xyli]
MSRLRRSAGKRKYTQAEREAFFVIFKESRSTTIAARELGFNPATCAQWVRKAGLARCDVQGGCFGDTVVRS